MKKFKEFISESWITDVLDSGATGWDMPYAKPIGKYIMKHGKKIGGKIPRTNYQDYDMNGQIYRVATHYGDIPYIVHKMDKKK